jgi:pimeloyl-ACP methyl ester carboxylesterase
VSRREVNPHCVNFSAIRPRAQPVVPENSIRRDSRGEGESGHHLMRWTSAQRITCTRQLTESSPPPIFIGSSSYYLRLFRRRSSEIMSMRYSSYSWDRSYPKPDAYAEYRRCFSDPATIHTSCEDYRAAASIDLVHDESDMDRKISCPVLVLWGANGLIGRKYDVLAIWRDRATQVSGKALPSSHWLAEEVPDETLAEVKKFLAA